MTARDELRREMTHNHLYMTDERADELIDAALAEHAHELAEQLRAWGQDGEARKRGDQPSPFLMWEDADRAADLIEPLAGRCSCGAPEGDDEESAEIRAGWEHSRSCRLVAAR